MSTEGVGGGVAFMPFHFGGQFQGEDGALRGAGDGRGGRADAQPLLGRAHPVAQRCQGRGDARHTRRIVHGRRAEPLPARAAAFEGLRRVGRDDGGLVEAGPQGLGQRPHQGPAPAAAMQQEQELGGGLPLGQPLEGQTHHLIVAAHARGVRRNVRRSGSLSARHGG